MATIERKAHKCVTDWRLSCEGFNALENKISELLAYQDRIARNEERERCIKAAQDAVCKVCAICYDVSNCRRIGCGYFNEIRKAIEEGGE